MPIPLITAAVRAAADQTNQRNQAETSIIGNAFNVLRGGLARDVSRFQQNDSAKTLSQGLAGFEQNRQKEKLDAINLEGLQKERARVEGVQGQISKLLDSGTFSDADRLRFLQSQIGG